eukprot:UN1536
MTAKLVAEFGRVKDENHKSEAAVEGFYNNAYLDAIVRRFEPPPAEYWETRLVELVILGTEDSKDPKTICLEVPAAMPCGYVTFLISLVLPPEVKPRLVQKKSGKVHGILKDSDTVPKEQILAAGFGDDWPYKEAIETPEQGPWEFIWKWHLNPENDKRCSSFQSRLFKIAGTWDDFKCTEMKWDGNCFAYMVTLGQNKWESFQILLDGSWSLTLYPGVKDGSPYKEHKLAGPDNRGHGKNWTMGFCPEDKGEPGCRYLVELSLDERGKPSRVHWRRISDLAEARKAEEQLAERISEAARQRKEFEALERDQSRTECERLEQERQDRRASV